MSETLEIFKPLKSYFAILCQQNCINKTHSDCDELINILSSDDCDPSNGLSENFKNSLSWFAFELKKADSPIGLYTIKNKLKEIFVNADKKDYINSVIETVKTSSELSGFKMEQDNGENTSYEQILNDVYDASKSIDNIFDEWFRKSFDTYSNKEKYFEDNIKPHLNDMLEDCEFKLLRNYFEVKVDGKKVSINDYMDKMNTDYKGKSARLNIIIEDNKPKLFKLLPESVKDAFEEYLIKPQDGSPVFFEYKDKSKCLLKISPMEPKKEEYKVQNVKTILNWFKQEALGVRKKTLEPEVVDEPDDEPYTDSDASEYKFPGSFQVVNYLDNWKADLSGRLWKKNTSTNKFEEYTDADLEKDSNSFGAKDGHCGNLCIFSDADKCAKFFERMMKRDSLSIKELSDEINNPSFVQSYKELKENIVKVNPLFVIGTLRMFGFEKYTELKDDGTKTVKIESFTRWWSRYGNQLTISSSSKKHPGLNPEPPANLELFFKLLITFINNNEFVLNPQSKLLINKSGKPKVYDYGAPKEFFMIRGKQVKNNYYERELAIYEGRVPTSSQPESLSGLVDLMRKNSLLGSRPVSMGLPENRTNLSSLLGLMVGITSGSGKMRIGREAPFTTGTGYVIGGSGGRSGSVSGGSGLDSDSNMLPCSKNALEIYRTGIASLKKKNKKLDSKDEKKISDEINKLAELEIEVYNNLYILANYVKVINVMNDEAANDSTTLNMMDEAIREYESKSSKLSSKSDSTISMLLKNLFDDKSSGPSSYYGKLY